MAYKQGVGVGDEKGSGLKTEVSHLFLLAPGLTSGYLSDTMKPLVYLLRLPHSMVATSQERVPQGSWRLIHLLV